MAKKLKMKENKAKSKTTKKLVASLPRKKKKIVVKIKKLLTKRKKATSLVKKPQPPQAEWKKQEVAVEAEKFSHAKAMVMQEVAVRDLPVRYNKDTLVLLVRDPWWIYAYWEISDATFERLKSQLKEEFYAAKRVLRLYDVTNVSFDGTNANRFFDIEINPEAMNWYIDTGCAGRSWCIDLGLLLKDGTFITILRSNIVETPLDRPSEIMDEEWMIPDDMFARLYSMGFGLGKSSPVGKVWRKAFVSSFGFASMASPVKLQVSRGFWLEVNCELIVYGATEPNATVTVQDKPITLRKDGTFTLRFALPDGKQVIPVKATSFDRLETKVITPIVIRETK